MAEYVNETNIHVDEFNSLAEAIVGLTNRWNQVHIKRDDFQWTTIEQEKVIHTCLENMGCSLKINTREYTVPIPNEPLSLLLQADKIINGERLGDYGPPRKSVERIAAIWSAYLGIEITWQQVCGMMIGLKLSRTAETPDHFDSWLDIAGYAGVWDKAKKNESDAV